MTDQLAAARLAGPLLTSHRRLTIATTKSKRCTVRRAPGSQLRATCQRSIELKQLHRWKTSTAISNGSKAFFFLGAVRHGRIWNVSWKLRTEIGRASCRER